MRTLLSVIVLLFASSQAAHAIPILSVDPSVTTTQIGTVINLDFRVEDAADLFAFQYDLSFDPTVLQLDSVSSGNLLSDGTGFFPGLVDNVAGSVSFIADSVVAGPGVSGDGILARATFLAFGAGASAINFSNVLLLDSGLNLLTDVVLSPGTVSVSASVPEPDTLALLALALTMLALGRRRTRRSPASGGSAVRM